MSTQSALSLNMLDSVKRLTEERHREQLDVALVQSLFEIAPVRSVTLYRVDSEDPKTMRRVHAVPVPLDDGEMAGAPPDPALKAALWQILADTSAGASDHVNPASDDRGLSFHPLRDRDPGGVVVIEHHDGACVEARLVNAVIGLYRNFVAVIDDAQRDTLTGLLNRKTFEKSVEEMLYGIRKAASQPDAGGRRVERQEAPNWLAATDIDHFKRINDAFGHLYGDEVLILMARLMLQSFRASDRVFRMGGEEFSVLLSHCVQDDAVRILERFRERVQNHSFPQVGQVTISIGYVAISSQDAVATVVDHADQALYASKHGGRNRVTAYASLPKADVASPAAGGFDLF